MIKIPRNLFAGCVNQKKQHEACIKASRNNPPLQLPLESYVYLDSSVMTVQRLSDVRNDNTTGVVLCGMIRSSH